jgi:hypothetical protein
VPPSDPEQSQSVASLVTPEGLVKAARKAHPAFKYAIVVAGIAALVAIVSKFGVSVPTLIFGVAICFFFMFVFLIFSVATRAKHQQLGNIALAVVWAVALFFILVLFLLLSSSFLDTPIKLRSYLEGLIKTQGKWLVHNPQDVSGMWAWPDGQVVKINADGTALSSNQLTATWAAREDFEGNKSANDFEFEWSDGQMDVLHLSGDGKTLKGIDQYNAQTDSSLQDLSVRTETLLAKGDAARLSKADCQRFLDESIGLVRVMRTKAVSIPNNEGEVRMFDALEQAYKKLADSGLLLRSSTAIAIRANLLALQHIQTEKKQSAMFVANRKE